jgi:[ribosomal protein S5]-alanine N-acetyltransferase
MYMEYATIETNRLILKAVTPAIIHQLFNTGTHESLKAFFGVDDEGLLHFREMHEAGMESFRISMFVCLITLKETNSVIGECGFHTWNRKHKRAELYYTLRDDQYKQKGIMSEALEKFIDHGFLTLDLHRIQALVYKENIPSLKLLLKNGFKFEGTLREDYVVNNISEDSECYSLLKKEWEKRSRAV